VGLFSGRRLAALCWEQHEVYFFIKLRPYHINQGFLANFSIEINISVAGEQIGPAGA
jgi:hypothetical protein